MSYPFFRCASCQNRVQQAVGCGGGYLPLVGFMRKGMRFSSLFDEEAEFASHCRGQGIMYNGRTPLQLRDASADGSHFNFAGRLSGLCCFCALKSGFAWFECDRFDPVGSGFGSRLFSQLGCINCRRKEWLRSTVSRLFGVGGQKSVGRSDTDAMTWSSDGWLALPSAVLDHIIVFVLGLDNCTSNPLPVLDGDVVSVARG